MRSHALTFLLVVIGVGFLIFGHMHWQYKIEDTIQKARAENKEALSRGKAAGESDRRLKYMSHLPSVVQEKLKKALHTGQPVRFVIAGSEATSTSEEAWPNLLKKQLEDAYGSQVFLVTVKEYQGMTTKTAIEADIQQQIIDLKPDIFLFEPFILNNNGVFPIADTLVDITTILDEVRSALPNVTIMLQPSHPIYNAKYYPLQVEELRKFADANGYIYFDHWRNWPDYRSEDIQSYLTAPEGLPNKQGHQVWGQFLADYFIAK